ncbi:MAG: PBP1A family penicillin-binding protein [Proteobacteria bacterium]|nr:PBP1A family penicillin-binding protein [Pseudomonadota bacterium]
MAKRSQRISSRKKAKNKPHPPRNKIWYYIFPIVLCFITTIWFIQFKSTVISEFEQIRDSLSDNTIFYDIKKQPFHIIRGSEDRKYRKLDFISGNLQKAVVAIEDTRYFKHFGFDPVRMVGAAIRLLKLNSSIHGASTITQQLVKLTLLTPERTIKRKIKELFMSIALEMEYSKSQILEFYLNKVYLGHRNYGVENAALNYFHKSASRLSLAESAFIAGLIKKPEGYSPYADIEKTRKRQVIVLKRLYTLNWISAEEYNSAINEKLVIKRTRESDLQLASYFTSHILLQLTERYGHRRVYGGGLRIFTTLNRQLQEKMEQSIDERLEQPRSFDQIAGISIDPKSGFVSALVGGTGFLLSEFNRATQARRQPGSAFKPVLYAAALDSGIKPNDVFVDEPTQYTFHLDREEGFEELEIYEPANFSGDFLGPITVSEALKVSNNVVSVQILDKIGIPTLVKMSQKLGIKIPGEHGLCLALGCGDLSLLKLVNAYSIFANKGLINRPVFILKITDSEGNVLDEYYPVYSEQAISQDLAFQMDWMLKNVIERGTGKAAKIKTPAGGKTGTSDGFRDAWFIGYTKELVTGFWIGNDDNSPMDREVGGSTPARLWKSFMQSIPSTDSEFEASAHDHFDEFEICDQSGKIATPWCPQKSWYPIKKGVDINEFCDIHFEPDLEVKICLISGLLSTQYCPIRTVETKRFYQGSEPNQFCNIHQGDEFKE